MTDTYNVNLTKEQINYLLELLSDSGELVFEYYNDATECDDIIPNEDGSFSFRGISITDPAEENTNTETLISANTKLISILTEVIGEDTNG